jgi:hypothetical protein
MNEAVTMDRRPLQHIARFVLMAVYTGMRSGAITSASISRGIGRSFVDLERGIYYRPAEGHRETKKRQPPRSSSATFACPFAALGHQRHHFATQ